MGQCYTVEARLKFQDNDPASFCKVMNDEFTARNGRSARFDLTKGNTDDPFGCFKILTSANANQTKDGIWFADFDGSYGWEDVLIQIFQAAAKELKDGSKIMIYPDSGSTEISVIGKKVVTIYK